MPTLRDVAQACGVSSRTVSRVINGQAYVREEKRRQILDAAERMGYRPNASARSLRSGKTWTVGIVANSVSSDTTLQRIEVISRLFNAAGFSILTQFAETDEMEAVAVGALVPRCDGLVVFTNLRVSSSPVLDSLALRNYPFILVDPPHSVPYPSVRINRSSGYRQAVRYLIHRGRRKVALVIEEFRSSERIEGFREGLLEEHVEFSENRIYKTTKGFEGGQKAAEWVAQGYGASRIDGLICHNDKMALGLLGALLDRGIRIPRDLALIGFDDDAFSAYLRPALTTIAQGGEDVGAYIFQQLYRHIEYGNPVESRTFDTGLIIRSST
jgi:LacI family transcriptional regulator